jgi:Tol biopolymer transport system component
MPADGAGGGDAKSLRLTNDAWEDWFPHPSPDGKSVLFLSFPPGSQGHNDRGARIQLRMIPAPGGAGTEAVPKVVTEFTGGQGTINVNSWSPDSKRFAYVTYEVKPS